MASAKKPKLWITIESDTATPEQKAIMEELLSECLQPYQVEVLKKAWEDTINLIIHGKP